MHLPDYSVRFSIEIMIERTIEQAKFDSSKVMCTMKMEKGKIKN